MSDGQVINRIDDMPGRRRLEPLSAEDQAAREQQRLAAVREFAVRASSEGWCPDCWSHSTDCGRFPADAKLVRHRRPENCPRSAS